MRTATSTGRAPAKTGRLLRVTLSLFETPVSVAAVMSGAAVGAAGASVSITTVSAGLNGETLPATSSNRATICRVPSASADETIAYVPVGVVVSVPTSTPSAKRFTRSLTGTAPLNCGALMRVTLSVLLRPVSCAVSRSGAAAGVGGATVSIVTLSGVERGPVKPLAGTRAAAVTGCAPSAIVPDRIDHAPPALAVAVPSCVDPDRSTTA